MINCCIHKEPRMNIGAIINRFKPTANLPNTEERIIVTPQRPRTPTGRSHSPTSVNFSEAQLYSPRELKEVTPTVVHQDPTGAMFPPVQTTTNLDKHSPFSPREVQDRDPDSPVEQHEIDSPKPTTKQDHAIVEVKPEWPALQTQTTTKTHRVSEIYNSTVTIVRAAIKITKHNPFSAKGTVEILAPYLGGTILTKVVDLLLENHPELKNYVQTATQIGLTAAGAWANPMTLIPQATVFLSGQVFQRYPEKINAVQTFLQEKTGVSISTETLLAGIYIVSDLAAVTGPGIAQELRVQATTHQDQTQEITKNSTSKTATSSRTTSASYQPPSPSDSQTGSTQFSATSSRKISASYQPPSQSNVHTGPPHSLPPARERFLHRINRQAHSIVKLAPPHSLPPARKRLLHRINRQASPILKLARQKSLFRIPHSIFQLKWM